MFRGCPGDVGGGRPQDVLGTNIFAGWEVSKCGFAKENMKNYKEMVEN